MSPRETLSETDFQGNAARDVLSRFAALVPDSPYAILPDLNPSSSRRQVQQHKLLVQKRMRAEQGRMTPQQDQAFRTLFKPPHRAIWDLLCLGTTPGVGQDAWRELAKTLHTDSSAEADVLRQWTRRLRSRPLELSALHVCALIALRRAISEVQSAGAAGDKALQQFIAFWSSLLLRHDWLHAFLDHRYRTWAWTGSIEESTQFVERTEKQLPGILERLTGEDPLRRAATRALWEREITSIEAMRKAGVDDAWTAWTDGFGPLGLEVLDEHRGVRQWLLKASRRYLGGTPIASLSIGHVRLTDHDSHSVSEAATAIHWLCSELGHAAADIWSGMGRSACHRLDAWRGDAPDAAITSWFGDGDAATLRRERAIEEMLSEALLTRLMEDIGRTEVGVHEITSTVDRIFQRVDAHRRPRVLLDQLETVTCGRLLDCLDDDDNVPWREIGRVLSFGDLIYQRLESRNAGDRLIVPLAALYRNRSIRRWNTACDLGFKRPAPHIQSKCLRDVLRAMELMPHEPTVLEALADFLRMESHLSPIERRPLLALAIQNADDMLQIGAGADEQQVRELRRELLQELDPAEAERETQEEIARVLRKNN